jgi:hypothetical protein
MTRRYDDPVEVRRRDEDPAEFLWRGRFYAVREVLEHWVETAAWWQAGSADSSALAAEREVWRVEAGAPGGKHTVRTRVRSGPAVVPPPGGSSARCARACGRGRDAPGGAA